MREPPMNGGFPTMKSAFGHSARRGLTYLWSGTLAVSSGISSPVTGDCFIVRPSQRESGFPFSSRSNSSLSQARTASRHSMFL